MENFYYQAGRVSTEEEVQRYQERLHQQESDERKYLFETVFTFRDIRLFVDRYNKYIRNGNVQDRIDCYNEMSEDLGLKNVGSFIWECYQRYPELKSWSSLATAYADIKKQRCNADPEHGALVLRS